MKKGNIENSLKRFLKRKVRFTLGLVVVFLITGTAGFAERPLIIGEENYWNENEWLIGVGENGKAIESGEIILKNDITDIGTIKSENGKITVIFGTADTAKTVVIENEKMSKMVSENANTAIKLAKNADSPEEIDFYINDDEGNYNKIFKLESNVNRNYTLKAGEISVNTGEITEIAEYSPFSEPNAWRERYYAGHVADNGGIVINKGIINTPAPTGTDYAYYYLGQLANGENSAAYNYGIIKNQHVQGQRAQEGAYLYNYGLIINNGNWGQFGYLDKGVFNYGIIANNGERGQVASNGYNYGIIINNGGHGQSTADPDSSIHNFGIIANSGSYGQEGSKAYNYGLIMNNSDNGQECVYSYNFGVIANNGKNGQHRTNYPTKMEKVILINYGLIINKGDNGQCIEKVNGDIKNFGIIANEGSKGQWIKSKVTGYNYGIIANKNGENIYSEGKGEEGKAYNYGVLYTKAKYGAVGNVENNGIIFLTENAEGSLKGSTEKPVNNGVVIIKNNVTDNKDNFSNKGIEINAQDINNIKISAVGDNMLVATNQSDIAEDKKFTGNSLAENKNLFVDRYTENRLTETLELNNKEFKGNHITAVVGKNDISEDKAVISTKNANSDLVLDNSSIVGYFEKNGTLLEVNGNVTLQNGSVINAITGNSYTGYTGDKLDKVVAVSLQENGQLTISDNSNVLGAIIGNGTLVLENFYGNRDYGDTMEELNIRTTSKNEKREQAFLNNLKTNHGVIFSGHETSTENTKIVFGNNIGIKGGLRFNEMPGEILEADITLGDGQDSSDKTISIDKITLGSGDDILTIQNALGEVGEINGNGGTDTVNLKNMNGKHDTFDYQLNNIEVLDLGNSSWKIGANAGISFVGAGKADGKTEIKNGTLIGELKGNAEKAEFVNNGNINNILESSTLGNNAKFQILIGKDMKLEAGAEYDIEDTVMENLEKIADKITGSSIFTKADGEGKDIRVKSAAEMNINDRYSGIYNEMLENASSDEEILNILNSSGASEIAGMINSKGVLGDTLATTGYKITRDISNSFMSAVNEWNKKAGKGEWLTNAKYISSDVEYDGANDVKGYDSDINSMVGMIEYGVSENTSYGIALGGGDTEVKVDGAGTLKGDNYYIGAYAKHSVNGFDLVGNIGYTISDLEVNGEGEADSSAITFGGYIKKDIALTETMKLEPNFSFTYDYIMQDNAEGSGIKVDNKDVHVFEASAGMNIVKEVKFETGVLELRAGAKYSMADMNRNEETIIYAFNSDRPTSLGEPEVDKTRGTANIGFDYEHETGFGLNGKYEMMWSDSGDDSRITAGMSYRF